MTLKTLGTSFAAALLGLAITACLPAAQAEAKGVKAKPGTAASAAGGHLQRGVASWYQYGKRTANGEAFNPGAMTAAHRTLPFGTRVKVVNERTGRAVVVRINDRGPFTGGRVIDLSRASAQAIGVSGISTVALYRI